MPQPSVLYDTTLFRQAPWRDERHLKTLCWMVAGRAEFAQSTVRRFSRWLSNPRIDARRLYVALDATVPWNVFCVDVGHRQYFRRKAEIPGRFGACAAKKTKAGACGYDVPIP